MASATSICWIPTFEPFAEELPSGCDWISFGQPGPVTREFDRLADRWKRDADGDALVRLVPERFVRSHLVGHISSDLTRGFAGQWDVSVDPLHGRVIGARFANNPSIETKGVALPFLVPRVGDLDWATVRELRERKELRRLRAVLREIEVEAFEVAASGGDLESALRNAHIKKLRKASENVGLLRSVADVGVTELAVGIGSGLAVTGLTSLGSVLGLIAGAGASAALITGRHVTGLARERRQQGWIGALAAIEAAASSGKGTHRDEYGF